MIYVLCFCFCYDYVEYGFGYVFVLCGGVGVYGFYFVFGGVQCFECVYVDYFVCVIGGLDGYFGYEQCINW